MPDTATLPAKLSEPERYAAELATMSLAELKASLTNLMGRTAEKLLRMALIVRELDNRGEDVRSLKIGMIGYLRMIASGQTTAEIVVRFADQPTYLRRIVNMSAAAQRKVLNSDDAAVSRMLRAHRPPAKAHKQTRAAREDHDRDDDTADTTQFRALLNSLEAGSFPKDRNLRPQVERLIELARGWLEDMNPETQDLRLRAMNELNRAPAGVKLLNLAHALKAAPERLRSALDRHPWFTCSDDQYRLTSAGRKAAEGESY